MFAETVTAAMAVHVVAADAAAIPVSIDPGLVYPGLYSIAADGQPVRIAVNPAVHRPRLTLLHEVGHFLDHRMIEPEGAWASTGPLFEAWRAAVDESDAVLELRRQELVPPLPQLARGMSYLLKIEELFARSYAQWIAIRSGNDALLDEVSGSLSGLSYPEYWGMDDFGPVADALDEAFKELKWIT